MVETWRFLYGAGLLEVRGGRLHFRPQNGASVLVGACVLLSLVSVGLCSHHLGTEGPGPEAAVSPKCLETERQALLDVRAGIGDGRQCQNKWRSSWEKIHGDECCLWEGVACDDRTGHVIKLDLRCTLDDYVNNFDSLYYDTDAYSMVSPSLVKLTSLRYLDLSGNYFNQVPLPSSIGYLVNLEHLNLSGTGFVEPLAPVLGNLQRLHSLDLSWNTDFRFENFAWLSHLSHLEYLDLSETDLSVASDWLQVMSKLPSLSILHLSNCKLRSLSTTLPIKFNSLSVLDLSWSYFNDTTWPIWLFNITTLTELDVSGNFYLRAPIPDSFHNLKHLEVLRLDGGTLDEKMLPPSILSLRKLRLLALSSLRLPDRVDKLRNLRELELWNVIGSVPESLGNLSRLESFTWEDYNISERSFVTLGNLVNLKSLHLSLYSDDEINITESLGNLTRIESLYMSAPGLTIGMPKAFGNLTGLKKLQWFSGFRNGSIPESLGNLNSLQFLELSSFGNQTIPESLGNLSNLETLILKGTIRELPASLGRLMMLKNLELEFYGPEEALISDDILSVWLPESIKNLINLKALNVDGFNISPELFRNMGHFCNLILLRISGNMEHGAKLDELVNRLSRCTQVSSLEILDLRDNRLSGHLPHQVRRLSNLRFLDLSQNYIVGQIPASIGDLQSLRTLTLDYNNLVGPIPSSIGKLSGLNYLMLENNFLNGSIPMSIGQLKSLKMLHLSENKLIGTIPRSIRKLLNLMNLDISNNQLEGSLTQAHFTNLSKLEYLDMSDNPKLSISLHHSWTPTFQLAWFGASNCTIGPKFPVWLEKQNSLSGLDLSQNLINESLPSNFFIPFPKMLYLNLSHNFIKSNSSFSFRSLPLVTIDLSFNYFTVAEFDLRSSSLTHLDLSHNSISGVGNITVDDLPLEYLDMSHNNIIGTIPSYICKINRLQILDLSHNYLTGGVPECLNNNTNLVALRLTNNKLHGTIPSSIGTLSQLQSLHLDKNNLNGVIPPSLKHLRELMTLDLGENKLSGVIPSWMGESLSSLQILRLRSNKFFGNIPMSLSHLQSLQILDLASNRLSGNLLLSFRNFSSMVKIEKPPKSYNGFNKTFTEAIRCVPKGYEVEYTTMLSFVKIIDLSDNIFSGQIPEEITSLQGLHFLNISKNHLMGEIPASISRMKVVESLDMSFNQLSGSIPSSISTMNFLNHFNVSYNNLSGRIPLGNQLQTFDLFSYIGNPGLCDPPLLRLCPNDPSLQASKEYVDRHDVPWPYIGIETGFFFGFWGFLGGLLVMERKRMLYFHFIDHMSDEIHVMIAVHFTRLKLKMSSWMSKWCL